MELLCERLGWLLYRPIGLDWFTAGYWNHERKWHGDAVARQYLMPWGSDYVEEWLGGDPQTFRDDPSHPGRRHRLVSLSAARDLKPDIVISSLAHNHEGFARFASEVGATFGLQVGNVRFSEADMAEDRWDLAAFGLVSGLLPVTPPKPHVVYHQEFSLDDFRYEPPPRGQFTLGQKPESDLAPGWYDKPIEEAVPGVVMEPRRVYADPPNKFKVASFVQCYPQDAPAYDYWLRTAQCAPELAWKVYGAYGEAPLDQYAAGNLPVCSQVGIEMRASDVAWHAKRWSDGFGHVLHNWAAVGRPTIGFHDYYRSQLGGRLWVEGVTSWDLGTRSAHEIAELLRRFRDDEDFHLRACEAMASRFRQVVSFDEEEQQIRAMFAQVLP